MCILAEGDLAHTLGIMFSCTPRSSMLVHVIKIYLFTFLIDIWTVIYFFYPIECTDVYQEKRSCNLMQSRAYYA